MQSRKRKGWWFKEEGDGRLVHYWRIYALEGLITTDEREQPYRFFMLGHVEETLVILLGREERVGAVVLLVDTWVGGSFGLTWA